jgi:Na+/H+-dicarboxylate symporter
LNQRNSDEHRLNSATSPGWLARWQAIPLYGRILAGVACGVVCGLLLPYVARAFDSIYLAWFGPIEGFSSLPGFLLAVELPGKLVLRLLQALAPALVLVAVIRALMHADLGGSGSWRLVRLLLLNTLVAIGIGLLVANVVRPGSRSPLNLPPTPQQLAHAPGMLAQFLENVPKSLFGPLGDEGRVLSVIFLAVGFGIALRRLRYEPVQTVEQLAGVALRALIIVLHWILEVIPLAVFGIVAGIIGLKGFHDFLGLGLFVMAVILALILQASYYLIRIRFGSWVRPRAVLRGTRDALVMAFSTGSSTATMPVTYACLKDRIGLREQSASMGALVGSNFNNDGTALYEAMAALFIAQAIGQELSIGQQLMVVVTSIVASVGAAGIPEAGLVTMTLVFDAVGLPKQYIAILLTVDWFLDRCRTTINVLGDVNVACLLDGRHREEVPPMPITPTAQLAAVNA